MQSPRTINSLPNAHESRTHRQITHRQRQPATFFFLSACSPFICLLRFVYLSFCVLCTCLFAFCVYSVWPSKKYTPSFAARHFQDRRNGTTARVEGAFHFLC